MAVQLLPDAGTGTDIRTIQVLLVEDNEGDAALVEASLAEECTGSPLRPMVALTRARSLAEARAALRDHMPFVVLLDLGLPDSVGLETLSAMRAACDLPIVVLTGLADEETALEALKTGAQDYLFKGDVAPGTTLRALRYAIERRDQERELARSRWLAGIGETVLAVLHEINNPLTSLVMNAELVAAGDNDRATIQAILQSARRISEVTRRLGAQNDPRSVEYVRGMRMLDLSDGIARR